MATIEAVPEDDPTYGLPELPEGMVWHQYPPNPDLLADPEWYDGIGRDKIDQRRIFNLEYPTRALDMIFKAGVKGKEDIIHALLESGVKPYPEPSTDDDMTLVPIHAAAYNGHLNCVKLLVEQGHVSANAVDDLGGTPLMRAAWGGHAEIVKWLLEDGQADPTVRQSSGVDALEFAAGGGNAQAARLLLEHPVYGTPGKRKYRSGEKGAFVTPMALEGGADFGSSEMVELLLERGAYPLDGEDEMWKGARLSEEEKAAIEGAVARAARRGHLQVLKLLLSYLTRTDEGGKYQYFELQSGMKEAFIDGMFNAAADDKTEVLELLWNVSFNSLDQDARNGAQGERADLINELLLTAAEGSALQTTKLLLEKYKVNVNHLQKPHPMTPLYIAAAKGHLPLVRYLLEVHKPDLHLGCGRYANGPTALFKAVENRHADVVKTLLQHGGPVEHVDITAMPSSMPANLFVTATKEYRVKVRLIWEENAYEWQQRADMKMVVLEMNDEDMEWWSKVDYRKKDEDLAEDGSGRELRSS